MGLEHDDGTGTELDRELARARVEIAKAQAQRRKCADVLASEGGGQHPPSRSVLEPVSRREYTILEPPEPMAFRSTVQQLQSPCQHQAESDRKYGSGLADGGDDDSADGDGDSEDSHRASTFLWRKERSKEMTIRSAADADADAGAGYAEIAAHTQAIEAAHSSVQFQRRQHKGRSTKYSSSSSSIPNLKTAWGGHWHRHWHRQQQE